MNRTQQIQRLPLAVINLVLEFNDAKRETGPPAVCLGISALWAALIIATFGAGIWRIAFHFAGAAELETYSASLFDRLILCGLGAALLSVAALKAATLYRHFRPEAVEETSAQRRDREADLRKRCWQAQQLS